MKEHICHLINELDKLYPEASCTLEYQKDYELLFATRLAAQCTDARVNIVCEELYTYYTNLEAIACANLEALEKIIRPCGFYHTKARDIKLCAEIILTKHNGRVPNTMEDLLKLPGVGRKTANLILGEVYSIPAIVVDTHCIRLSNRLRLVQNKDPKKIEDELALLIDPELRLGFCHRLVCHGRAVCLARKPRCLECSLTCPWSGETEKHTRVGTGVL